MKQSQLEQGMGKNAVTSPDSREVVEKSANIATSDSGEESVNKESRAETDEGDRNQYWLHKPKWSLINFNPS